MAALSDPAPSTNLARPARWGLALTILLFGIIAVWAWSTLIASAVIASGQIVVRGKPKVVQHLDGGSIVEIRVTDGQRVAEDEVLMVLDDTVLRANLDIYRTRLAETLARRARLEAEQADAEAIVADLPAFTFASEIDISSHLAGQIELFEARRESQLGQAEQLAEKVRQFENQIRGVESLIASKREQLGYVEKELASTLQLSERGLALESQVLALQKSQADLLGQIAEHESELARIGNSIADSRLEIVQSRRKFTEEVVTELRDIAISVEEMTHQILSTEKQIDRVRITAPVAGIVHEMQIVTVGGVVPPGAAILQLIPLQEGVDFEVNVPPVAVDQVYPGQVATVRFPAFNQQTTPELVGTVSAISASAILDQTTGASYFRVTLDLPPDEIARLGEVELVPGMPVEAHLKTGERSVLSFFLKPLADHLAHAFREE